MFAPSSEFSFSPAPISGIRKIHTFRVCLLIIVADTNPRHCTGRLSETRLLLVRFVIREAGSLFVQPILPSVFTTHTQVQGEYLAVDSILIKMIRIEDRDSAAVVLTNLFLSPTNDLDKWELLFDGAGTNRSDTASLLYNILAFA